MLKKQSTLLVMTDYFINQIWNKDDLQTSKVPWISILKTCLPCLIEIVFILFLWSQFKYIQLDETLDVSVLLCIRAEIFSCWIMLHGDQVNMHIWPLICIKYSCVRGNTVHCSIIISTTFVSDLQTSIKPYRLIINVPDCIFGTNCIKTKHPNMT